MAKRKAKKAKRKKHPAPRKKRPKAHQDAPNVESLHFKWSVNAADFGGNWSWGRASIILLFSEIIPKLQNYETRKWGDLASTGSHFITCDKLCKEAQNRLEELEKEDIAELFSLRFDGRKRIFGQRIGACFCLLWWDPEHTVCPSPNKHT